MSSSSRVYTHTHRRIGDAYHGYWIQDSTQLNDKFGTSDDLLALSKEIHQRDMYLMVDVVVNDVMALSTNPDYSIYMFKDAVRAPTFPHFFIITSSTLVSMTDAAINIILCYPLSWALFYCIYAMHSPVL